MLQSFTDVRASDTLYILRRLVVNLARLAVVFFAVGTGFSNMCDVPRMLGEVWINGGSLVIGEARRVGHGGCMFMCLSLMLDKLRIKGLMFCFVSACSRDSALRCRFFDAGGALL